MLVGFGRWFTRTAPPVLMFSCTAAFAVCGREQLKEILDLLKSTHNKMVLTFQRAVVSEVRWRAAKCLSMT